MNDGVPRVSVIIPCYNCAETIGESIASVLRQDFDDIEAIVVDDGSSDNSAEIADGLGAKVLLQPHRGASAARNAGVDLARGEYVAFLDADDVWIKSSLVSRMDLFKRVKGLGLAFSDFEVWHAESGIREGRYFDGRSELEELECEQIRSDAYLIKSDPLPYLLKHSFISTITVVMPKFVYYNVGGFDESLWMGEDVDMWLRVAGRYPIAYTTYATAIYRRRSTSITGNRELISTGLVKTWSKFRRLYAKQYPALHAMFARNLASYAYDAGRIKMDQGANGAARMYLATCIRWMPRWRSAWFCYLRTYKRS